MKIDNVENYLGGWLVGDFQPALFHLKNCEICVKEISAGYKDERHYHMLSTEFNVIISGRLLANGSSLKEGDIFIYGPSEVNDVEVLEDTILLVIRDASNPLDKHTDLENLTPEP